MGSAPSIDVERYLDRLGVSGRPEPDLATLIRLQRAHMTAVPFENLDVYRGIAVGTGLDWSVPKILDGGRGGWCFELNGAFGALLEALGFTVRRLGAAVQLAGPSDQVDHLALEVMLDRPHLVDVGFGDGPCRPLALDQRGVQDGLAAPFELFGSPRGTTLARHRDGVPEAQYRFKRVHLDLADLEPASGALQANRSLPWHRRAFATRLLDGGPDRVTLVGRTLKLVRRGLVTERPVADEAWVDTLETWFGFRVELGSAPERDNVEGR